MKHLRFLPLLFGSVALLAQPSERPAVSGACQHAEERNQELIHDGFNFGQGFTLGGKAATAVIRASYLITPTESEYRLLFWVEADGGEVRFRLIGPDGKEVLCWQSAKGELPAARRLPAGKYILEIDATTVRSGYALLAVKGPIMNEVVLDPARFQELPAAPEAGYHWPFLLFVPKQIKTSYLLVVPNNTGFETTDLELLRASASSTISDESVLADRLGCPLLVPLFPRPPLGESNLYLHALSRESLLTTVVEWKRVDLQLLAMIQHARVRLQERGLKIDARVMLSGFSAAGDFVNRFAMLHPEQVLAVAGGGLSWPIAPVGTGEKEHLRYPVGVADLDRVAGEAANSEALRSVAWFLFRGAADNNEPLDFRDCFAGTDAALIRRRFGGTPAARWSAAEKLYAEAGLTARLMFYPEVGHTITPAIAEEVAQFFEKRLREIGAKAKTTKP